MYRVRGHELLRPRVWAPVTSLVAAYELPWAAVLALGFLALVGAATGEWQRRRTLLAILQHAPAGSVVEQESGTGAGMRVQIGGRCRPPRRGGGER